MVMDTPGFGLDPGVIVDPINTQITNANIAGLIKSSEAMGEMMRRIRDLIAATGRQTSGDAVLAALAADMQDGKLDGLDASGTDPRISAVAKVVSGQVLLEALANTLKVGGIIATPVIDQAILTTRPGISTDNPSQSVRITEGMLQQTQTALAAARVLDSSAEVIASEAIVSNTGAGTMPGDVANVLPADSSRSLDNAGPLTSTADTIRLAATNATGEQNGGTNQSPTGPVTTDPVTTDPVTTAPVNNAPVISGSPAGVVVAGTAYSFQPAASDADGDTLTLSISGKPAWAGFDITTGRLSGTPGGSGTGTCGNIVIAVTDGTDTATLQTFTISVDPAQITVGGFTLAWTAP